MSEHILYYSSYCPFCIRVLYPLKGKKHDIELRETSNPEYWLELQQGGGKTQVPCLRIERNGEVQWMYESGDIIQYLKEQRII